MQDTIIKGTGNSRSIKGPPNLLTLYPTWEAAAHAMIDGTFPIDLGPLNPSGVQKIGTNLDTSALLKDTTAALYGLTGSAVPDEVLSIIHPVLSAAKLGADMGTRSAYGAITPPSEDGKVTISLPGQPILIVMYETRFISGFNYSTFCVASYPAEKMLICLLSNYASSRFDHRVAPVAWGESSISVEFEINQRGKEFNWVALCLQATETDIGPWTGVSVPEKLALPLAEGWSSHYAGGSVDGHCYRKSADGLVTLTLDIHYSEITTGTKTVGILPEGYRPDAPGSVHTVGYDMGRMLPISLSVRYDGSIFILPMRNSGVHPGDAEYQYFTGTVSFYAG